MSANVEPEELEAIQDVVEQIESVMGPRPVERRDFNDPRRLSSEELRQLGRQLAETLPGAAQALALTLRKNHKLTLVSLSEVNAGRLFTQLESPYLVWCFEFGQQPAWLIWDPQAAARVLGTVLCGDYEEEQSTRAFCSSERRVLVSLLSSLVDTITAGFGESIESTCMAQDDEELDAHKEIPGGSDSLRMLVHLSWDGPGGESDLRLYLPGITGVEPDGEKAPDLPLAVPDHVSEIPLEVVAYLGAIDVPLADLLGIEPGDVLPIDLPSHAPLEMYVEDRRYATAAWGKHEGRLALKLLEIDSRAGSIDQPEL